MAKHWLAITIVRPVQEYEPFWFLDAAGSVLDNKRPVKVLNYIHFYTKPIRAYATIIMTEVERLRVCELVQV